MKLIVTVFFLSIVAFHGQSQVVLPNIIRDSMVLQRDSRLKIWGWASPGEKISIKFNGKTVKTVAGTDGKWTAVLPASKAGGPFTMEIKGKNSITLKDILVGDVWLCSGQSNMVHQMVLHNITYADDIAKANFPEIRQFWIPTLTDLNGPKQDLPPGSWKWANPTDVNQFSAVAYFFARKIYEKYHIPIGIINSSVGGTPIEAWTSEEGLKEFPKIEANITRNKDTAFINSFSRRVASAPRPQQDPDKGLTESVKWYDPNYVPKGWQPINIPGYWEDQGVRDLDGVVWYRREIDVPASMTGVPAKVFLGRIVDADILYINGVQVGNTTYQYPQRRYALQPGVLKPGKNLFVVKVTNTAGKGGFVTDKPYAISAAGQTIDLKGYWQFKVGVAYQPFRGGFGGGISAQNQPTALYNAMIAPFIDYAIKGVCWYQGEANSGNNASAYNQLLPALIKDWRHLWGLGDFPFLYVQLPNFGDENYHPSESGWAVVREACLKTLSVPNTGMAVTIDVGEWNDIHPDDKKDVGDRLALAAEKIAYGEKDIVYSGPLYDTSKVDGNKIVVSFTNIGSGLASKDGEELSQFAIAGSDKKFVWANAKIEGDKVVIWNDAVQQPMYVRYAWADNPYGANLSNKEGLPASPFRTDQ
jgi:sialate O-acetylesterase